MPSCMQDTAWGTSLLFVKSTPMMSWELSSPFLRSASCTCSMLDAQSLIVLKPWGTPCAVRDMSVHCMRMVAWSMRLGFLAPAGLYAV